MPSAFFRPPRRGLAESRAAGTGQAPPPASLKGLCNPAQDWTAVGQQGGGPTLGSGVKRASTLKAVASNRRTCPLARALRAENQTAREWGDAFGGVRPFPGAATYEGDGALMKSGATTHSVLAAPEGGRTPAGPDRRSLAHLLPPCAGLDRKSTRLNSSHLGI